DYVRSRIGAWSAAPTAGRRASAGGPVSRLPFDGELDDLLADGAEVVAACARQHWEEADRGEARDGVDLVEVQDALLVDHEVDPGESLGADRQIGLPGEVVNLLS